MKRIKNLIIFSAVALFATALMPSQALSWGRGHFYIIGTGPAGPRMATLQALDTIKTDTKRTQIE